MTFENFVILILIFFAGFAVGWAMCNSTWIDHAYYGWQRRIGNYCYIVKKVNQKVIV